MGALKVDLWTNHSRVFPSYSTVISQFLEAFYNKPEVINQKSETIN